MIKEVDVKMLEGNVDAYGSDLRLDITGVDDFYNEDEGKKKDWDNLLLIPYLSLLYYRFLQVIQQGYVPTTPIKEEEFKVVRPVQNSITGEVDAHIRVAPKNFTFGAYVGDVREALERRKSEIFEAFLRGEISSKGEYQELEGVRRKCLEFCNHFLSLSILDQDKFIEEKINLDILVGGNI